MKITIAVTTADIAQQALEVAEIVEQDIAESSVMSHQQLPNKL